MSFKKIDAAGAAGGQPFDAFTLHGVLANQGAAYEGRARRAQVSFEPGNEPRLASALPLVGLPVVWPLSPGCEEVQASLLVAVADGAVRLRPVVSQGERDPWVGDEVALTSSDGLAQLTYNTSGFSGLVLLGVEVRSDLDDAEVDKFSLHETGDHAYLRSDTRVYLGSSANLALDDNTRYALRFGPGAAGEAHDPEFLPPATVFWWDRSLANVDEVDIWPPYSRAREESWLGASIEISVHKLAQMRVYSMSVEETAFRARADLRDALRPGMAPAARTLRQLHKRNYEQHLRTKVHALGGYPDASATDRQGDKVTAQGVAVPFEDLFIVDVGVFDASTTYTVTISGTAHSTSGQASAAATRSALRTAIRSSSDNALVIARLLGSSLVLSYRTAAQSPGISVSATGGTGTITLTSTAARGLGAAWVGHYSDDKGVVDGETGDAANRCSLRVAALLLAAGSPGADELIEPTLTARLRSFDSGAWTGDSQTATLGSGPVLCLRNDNDQARRSLRLLRYWLSNQYSVSTLIPRHGARWHTLRGMTPRWAFREPWVSIIEGAVTDAQPAETHRLLRLLMVGSEFNVEGVGGIEPTAPRLVECPTFTVWGSEEVRP
jgi:hypothetical protein